MRYGCCWGRKSLPSRGAWIEMLTCTVLEEVSIPSLPSRGAWIEMTARRTAGSCRLVAPLAGSVDRNHAGPRSPVAGPVAPLAGSVDRNKTSVTLQAVASVSLPSRGAWIEIGRFWKYTRLSPVAPLAGSVDRNRVYCKVGLPGLRSLPSRGAWIEIHLTVLSTARKWSLPSRGAWIEIAPFMALESAFARRSPRGERG